MFGSTCIFAVILGFFVTMIAGKTCPFSFVKGTIKDVKNSIFVRNKLFLVSTIFIFFVITGFLMYVLH